MGQDYESNFGFLCRRLVLDCSHKHEVPRSGWSLINLWVDSQAPAAGSSFAKRLSFIFLVHTRSYAATPFVWTKENKKKERNFRGNGLNFLFFVLMLVRTITSFSFIIILGPDQAWTKIKRKFRSHLFISFVIRPEHRE
jgi:hypothetical protein